MEDTGRKAEPFFPSRRRFVQGLLASVPAATCAAWSEPRGEAVFTFDRPQQPVNVPLDFTGLSYESAQLSNPHFFSGSNRELIALFRGLGRRGILRLGGGASDYTTWTGEEAPGGPADAIFGPDTSHRAKRETLTTPLAIRNLKAFLDATDWNCLYGLNMARGSTAQAAREAAYVQQTLGTRLTAFQLGNEPDAWRKRYRPADFDFPDYFAEWKKFRAAVLASTPRARFAGPDVSHRVDWVASFAEQAHGMIVMLTSHYYAEGPAGSPNATLDRLLDPNPRHLEELRRIMAAARKFSLPYRMTEGNSCWNGGQPGVSDTLGAALWCADMMLEYAQAGACGVNLHGGGNGYYTPIAGGGKQPLIRRPDYFGMQFAEKFAGAVMLPASVASAGGRISAYAGRANGDALLAIVNKSAGASRLRLPAAAFAHLPRRARGMELSGPAVDSTHGTALRQTALAFQPSGDSVTVTIEPYRALGCAFPASPEGAG